MYKLDYSKAQTLQLTNDAFFYLRDEEEPLDEDNLEEAQEIMQMFPCGFIIKDDWSTVDDSDLIEATFIPYVEEDWQMDGYIDMFNNWQIQIKYLNASQIKIRYYSPVKEPWGEQICDINYNDQGRPYFRTELGSMIPLWKRFIKVSQ